VVNGCQLSWLSGTNVLFSLKISTSFVKNWIREYYSCGHNKKTFVETHPAQLSPSLKKKNFRIYKVRNWILFVKSQELGVDNSL
jgi:hypothetical protein